MGIFRQPSILIADDNLDLAMSLSILLKLVGFEVATVHTGNDALAAARTSTPDVILLDIGLPDLNGVQVAEELRRDDRFKKVAIIAASGYSPDMARGRVKPELFDHYLVKPVDFGTLLPLLQKRARHEGSSLPGGAQA